MHVFPDTNILLHYRPLAEIDWNLACGTADVHLVLCMQVIDELDGKKKDSRLGPRAERAIKEIQAAATIGVVRPGLPLEVFIEESVAAGSSDSQIIQQVKLYAERHPGVVVAIATEDYGMKLRCNPLGIQTVGPQTAERLPNPQDELTKKVRESQLELDKLRNRMPLLRLCIRPHGESAVDGPCSFVVPDIRKARDVDAVLDRIRAEQTEIQQKAVVPHDPAERPLDAVLRSATQRHFDKSVDEYVSDYRKYLESLQTTEMVASHMFRFDLILQNDGRGAATEVDVTATFPNGVTLSEKDLGWPAEPRLPKLRSYLDIHAFDSRVFADIDGISKIRVPERARCVLGTEGWQVTAKVRLVKHGHSETIGTYSAFFGIDDLFSFGVTYEISAVELLDKARDSINVKVSRS